VEIRSLYANASVRTRCFLSLRELITPYSAIAASFHDEGLVLDLGCGHGLLAFALAITGRSREIVAVDHDAERIRLARSAMTRLEADVKLRFEVGDLTEVLGSFAPGSLSGVAMIDMLHYFDADTQRCLISGAERALRHHGVLAVREIDSSAGMRGVVNRFYERVATGTGFTRSSSAELSFRGANEWRALLEGAGFLVDSQPCGLPFLADVLFVGRKLL
jgi:SAM-dependent methyltransferase